MKEAQETEKGSCEFQRLLRQERLILEATEFVFELMESNDMSKADLARALGKSRSHVSQLLDGSRNMTLRTLADMIGIFGRELSLRVKPITPHPQNQRDISNENVISLLEHLKSDRGRRARQSRVALNAYREPEAHGAVTIGA